MRISMKIEFNKTYEFDYSGKVAFADLSEEELYALYRDGRMAGPMLERQLPKHFPEIEFVDGKGYDHIDTETGVKYDLKGFTKGGANYAPSIMVGGGRKINVDELHKHAVTINYILSDITEFPKVRIVFKRGTDLVDYYPKGTIPYRHKELIFE